MKNYKDITNEVRQSVCAEYTDSDSIKILSEKYSICVDLIYQILYEEGVHIPAGTYKPYYKNRTLEWKTAVADYYMQPNTRFETKDFFRTSDRIVDMVIAEFNLPKRTQAEELEIAHIHTFGSHEKYVEHMTATTRETSMNRYGVDNFAKSSLFREKSIKTSLKNYGVENPMQCAEVKQRLSDNCMSKFGVAWPCMREEAKLGGVGSDSGPNLYFFNLLKQRILESSIKREFCVEKYNYDFKVGNNLIEIDPASTHNSTWGIFKSNPKERTYHQDKTKLAEKHGYRCIHVWDWDNKDAIINILVDRPTVFARKCVIKELDRDSAKNYLNEYHLQGYAKDDIRLGLFYQDTLVSVMTFGKPRYNKNYQYELIRYCAHYNIVGGAEKLFSHFIKTYIPSSVISYCDMSKFSGKTYSKLGFKLIGTSIGKHWVSMKNGRHITDNLLRQRGFDQLLGSEYGYYGKGTSNEALMLEHGFVVVYDAGQATYVWQNS